MLYDIDWDITFKNSNGSRFRLALLAECEIVKSVENLTDTATIVLPETVINQPLSFEGKISRGTQVTIQMGYNGQLKDEFKGYVRDIVVNNGSIKIMCEDALFLFRKGVKDCFFENKDIKHIAEYVTRNIDKSYKVVCDYSIVYEKFTIHQASGYDVLKKIKEELKANIFFDTKNKILHIHKPYGYNTNKVRYNLQKNVEVSSLDFESVLDKKVEVTVESTDKSGKVQKYTTGTTGGDKITIKVGTIGIESIKMLAETTLKNALAPKYKGTFDTWLIPYCEPGFSAHIEDEDYPDKKGWYYVVSVTTNLSLSGGKRIITPDKKLGNG